MMIILERDLILFIVPIFGWIIGSRHIKRVNVVILIDIYLSSGSHQFYTRVFISRICVFKRLLTWSLSMFLFRCAGSFTIRYTMCIQTSSLLLSWNLVIFVWSSVENVAKNVPLAPCVENLRWDFLFCIK